MIIIWVQSNSPSQTAYGSDLSSDDMQFEKEYWKPRTTFRYVFLTARFHCLSADSLFLAVRLCRFMTLPGVQLGSTSLREARTTSPGSSWCLRVITSVSADVDRTHNSQVNAFPRLLNITITCKVSLGIRSTNTLPRRAATALCMSTASLPNQAPSMSMLWAKTHASRINIHEPQVHTVDRECSVVNPLQVTLNRLLPP